MRPCFGLHLPTYTFPDTPARAAVRPDRRAGTSCVRERGDARLADAFKPYLDAGFTGFTFNNTIYRTPESIGRVGELLRLIGG